MEAKKIRLDVAPTIMELPNEILLKIFSFLPQKDHHAVGLVSNRFQAIIDNLELAETSMLKISEKNLQEVKDAIADKNCKLCFKLVEIENVTSIEDLNHILQAIGKQVQFLTLKNTTAFELLKCNLIYLKSLVIYFDEYLENSVNNGSFNLCIFPCLEQLTFLHNTHMFSTTIKLLEQLKLPNTSCLRNFTLICTKETEAYLINTLCHHSSTLEILAVHFYDHSLLAKWEIPFSRMKSLKKFGLSGDFSDKMLNAFYSMIPRETSLEHLELDGRTNFDINKMLTVIVEKWMHSLQYLKLICFDKLTDVTVMELGKLHKLRILKLSYCPKITKMGLLTGIAIEKNISIEELHLENLSNLDELGMSVMISRFPNLRVLTVMDSEKAITNTSFASICRSSTRLRCLSINNCLNITDDGLIGFGNNPYSINRLRLLQMLSLNNCRCLTDRTLIEALHLPALRLLELRDCHKITMKGIESLVKGCPFLVFLSLPSTVMIADNALFVIGNGLKYLRQLNITYCCNITKEVCDHMKDVFKALRDSITNATFAPDCQMNMLT